jgi:hypothetical protein
LDGVRPGGGEARRAEPIEMADVGHAGGPTIDGRGPAGGEALFPEIPSYRTPPHN